MFRLWLDKMERSGELEAMNSEYGYNALTKIEYMVCTGQSENMYVIDGGRDIAQ